MLLRTFISIIGLAILSNPAIAFTEYNCPVSNKWDTNNIYSQAMIDKWKYAVVIREHIDSAYLSRCSNDSSGKFSCDQYKVDRIEKSSLFGSEIRKYYVFASQFDVQLFENAMTFIENDGRGSIAMGKCSLR